MTDADNKLPERIYLSVFAEGRHVPHEPSGEYCNLYISKSQHQQALDLARDEADEYRHVLENFFNHGVRRREVLDKYKKAAELRKESK